MLSSSRRSSRPAPALCRPDPHRHPLNPAWWLAAATLPVLAAAWAGAAHGQAQGSLTVQAQVDGACTVDATPLNFGDYLIGQQGNLDVDTTLSITCPNGSMVTIELGPGGNAAAGERRMSPNSGTGDPLRYNLYQEPARTTVWGNGALGTSQVIIGFSQSSDGTQTVYGRVPSGQNVGVGSYSDQVTITVHMTPMS